MFVGVSPFYGAIWFKIKRTTQLMNADTRRYQNSAKRMMVFVVYFFFQWWAVTPFYVWGLASAPPPVGLTVVTGAVTNLGGVYKCIAYTVIRQQAASKEQRSLL